MSLWMIKLRASFLLPTCPPLISQANGFWWKYSLSSRPPLTLSLCTRKESFLPSVWKWNSILPTVFFTNTMGLRGPSYHILGMKIPALYLAFSEGTPQLGSLGTPHYSTARDRSLGSLLCFCGQGWEGVSAIFSVLFG